MLIRFIQRLPKFLVWLKLLFPSALIIWIGFCLVLSKELLSKGWMPTRMNLIQQSCFFSIITIFFIMNLFWILRRDKKYYSIFIVGLISIFIVPVFYFNSVGLLAALLIFGSAFCLGKLVLKSEGVSINVILGLSLIIGVLNYVSKTNFNYEMIYLLLFVVPILYSIINFYKSVRCTWDWSQFFKINDRFRNWSFFDLFLMIILAVLIIPAFMNSFRPEMGFDALAYQLIAPTRLYYFGRYDFDILRNSLALMPQGINWLFGAALILSGEPSLNFFVFCLGALVLLTVIEEVARNGSPTTALLCALFIVSIPLFELATGSAFIENGMLLFCLGSVFSLKRFFDSGKEKWLFTFLFLASATTSIKHTGLFWLLICGIIYFSVRHNNPRAKTSLRSNFAVGLLSFFLFVLPVYGFSYWKSGNPFFPFFNGVFKSPYFDSGHSFTNALFQSRLSLETFFDITMHSDKFLEGMPGSAGILFLFLVPFSLPKIRRSLSWTDNLSIASFGFFLIIFNFQSYLRYLYPAIIMIGVVAIINIFNDSGKVMKNLAIGSIIFFSLVSAGLRMTSHYLPDFVFNWKEPISETRKSPLFMSPERRSNQYLNDKYGEKFSVVNFRFPYNSFLKGTYYAWSWHSRLFEKEGIEKIGQADFYNWLKSRGITHITYGDEQEELKKNIAGVLQKSKLEKKFDTLNLWRL